MFNATRCVVSSEARSLNSLNRQLSTVATESRLSSPTTSRPYNPAKSSTESAIGFNAIKSLNAPFFSITASASKTLRSHQAIDCSSYSVSSAPLGPFIDRRHWFAEPGKDDVLSEEVKEILKRNKNRPAADKPSLESLRKRIKMENQKDPEVPPGWEEKKK